jgi:hypothetical protein
LTDASGKLTYTYNVDGTLNTITALDKDAIPLYIATYAYNVDGTLNTITWEVSGYNLDNIVDTFSYNVDGTLNEINTVWS